MKESEKIVNYYYKVDISKEIKEAREKKNLTIKELANLVGVNRQTCYLWETKFKGIRLNNLIKLIDVLDLDLKEDKELVLEAYQNGCFSKIKSDIGSIIRNRRNELDITQAFLAKMMNVNPSTINRWEKGDANPSIQNLRKLDEALDLELDYNKILK